MTASPDRLDAAYWAARYQQGETGWDLRGPTPALVWLLQEKYFPVKPPATILVPGCGYGHDALLLATEGYTVTALDWAPEPLTALKQNAPPTLHTCCADFFDHAQASPSTYHAIWEYTFYCAITPGEREAYFAAISELLKADGYWIALLFPLGSQPYEVGPPFALSLEETRRLAAHHGLIERHTFPQAPSHPARQGREILTIFQKSRDAS